MPDQSYQHKRIKQLQGGRGLEVPVKGVNRAFKTIFELVQCPELGLKLACPKECIDFNPYMEGWLHFSTQLIFPRNRRGNRIARRFSACSLAGRDRSLKFDTINEFCGSKYNKQLFLIDTPPWISKIHWHERN
jgi:hypothetical protein